MMTANEPLSKRNRLAIFAEVVISLGLFLLALLPRAYALQRFVTADEAKWVYRSAQFLAAFWQGDFSATSVNLTPAVTTTWLGSLGLTLYFQFNQAALNVPFTDWLLALPQFRTELDLLAATRWPMVIFSSLGVVLIYWLARRLLGRLPAFVGAVLVAFDPQTVALSRILGHDAPVAIFMTLSLLWLLLAVKPARGDSSEGAAPFLTRSAAHLLPLILSGAAAGLAFLSKAPAFFLVPFTGLVFLGKVWGRSTTLYFWFKRFLLWGVVAYLVFIAFWPAAWVEPVARPLAVVENAFLSATDQEEADTEGYWLVPELGPFYYLVNGTFKLSPLVMVGAALAIGALIQSRQRPSKQLYQPDTQPKNKEELTTPPANLPPSQSANPVVSPASTLPTCQLSTLRWLFLFVLLFTLFMTLSDKRSPRYILPAFPPLALMAAWGWVWLYQVAGRKWQVAGDRQPVPANRFLLSRFLLSPLPLVYAAVLAFSALIILLPYAPYYFTYFNPLVGGPFTAPYLVKIGWGEGLDRVGRFLQREGDLRDSRVGTAYASTVAPFFEGDLSSVSGPNLDFVVLYTKQVQSGRPSPTFIRYFDQLDPIFSVELNGIHYADVYPGPAVQPSLALTPGLDHVILPKPIGFRPLTPYGHIGEPLPVDVLWLADEPLPRDPSTVTLEPISAFDFLNEHNHLDGRPEISPQTIILAQGRGRLTRPADKLVVSRHQLPLPAELERGIYALLVDGRPLGEIELRSFQVPDSLGKVSGFIFGEQIALAGYQFEPTEDYIRVTIAWQAQKSRLPDYTVFVQLLDAETNQRLTGVDTQPFKGEWPTSRWVRGEVVVDQYVVAVPPDLPPGFYKIIAGLYRPQTGRRLTLPDGRDHFVLPWTYIRNE